MTIHTSLEAYRLRFIKLKGESYDLEIPSSGVYAGVNKIKDSF